MNREWVFEIFTIYLLDNLGNMWYNEWVVADRKAAEGILKIEQCTTSEQALESNLMIRLWESQKRLKNQKKVIASVKRSWCFGSIWRSRGFLIYNFHKEFDPGSGRTLAARLTHASRTEIFWVYLRYLSGGRVSNTWATYLGERDSFWKRMVIPHNIHGPHDLCIKDLSLWDGLASD